jgi:hypothetical protein
LARYSDHRLGFRAAESPAFCPRRSAARKCLGQCRRGGRSRPWTGKADRSMCDFPSFRLREHYCRRWVDMGSRAEKAPAAQRADPAALSQLGSRVLLRLRRWPQDSAFSYLFSTTWRITSVLERRVARPTQDWCGRSDSNSARGSRHGNALGLFREMDSNAKNPLLRTTAEKESIQKVS